MWERLYNPGIRRKTAHGYIRPGIGGEYVGGRPKRGETDFQERGKFRRMQKRRAKAGRRVPELLPVRNVNKY